MSSIRFLCFTQAMREQRFFHNPRAALARLLYPNPAEIPIHWIEAAGIAIEIHVRHIEMASHGAGTRSKPVGRQGHREQFTLDAETQKTFAGSPTLGRRAA